jgi:hypothetical protein
MAAVFAALWPSVATGAPDAPHAVVAVEVNAADNDAEALAVELRDAVQRLDLRMRLEHGLEPPASWPADALAGVWIDASRADRVVIAVTDLHGRPDAQRYARTLPREGSVAVLSEQVAQVVRASLESILAMETERASSEVRDAGGDLVRDASAPPDAASTEPPGAVATSVGVDVAAIVSEQAASANSGPVFGVGGAARVAVPAWRLGLVASGGYEPRFDAQSQPPITEVSVASFRLMPTVALLDLDALEADLGAGGGLDVFSVAPLVVHRSMAAFDGSVTKVDAVVSGQLALHLRLTGYLSLLVAFDIDYDLSAQGTTPPVPGIGAPVDAFEPWRLRPMVAFGACVPITSAGACAKPR